MTRKAAAIFLRKDARINIGISSVDLQHLKQKAVYEGIPYQTFITRLLGFCINMLLGT